MLKRTREENSEPISGLEKPLVSFVLLAYNQEEFIREAIEGAFAQTYEPLEIVISDDCSTDRTYAVMQEMVAAYNGPHTVCLNRNEINLGIGPHVQYAAGLAKGAYVVLAGGDDVSLPERVSKSVEVVEQHGELGGVFGRCHEFSGEFRDEGKWEPEHAVDGKVVRGGNPEDWFSHARKGKVLGTPGCVAMWNKKLFDEFSPMSSGVLAEDLVLGCRALFSGLGVGFTSAGFVQYRKHDSNCYCGVSKELFERRLLFSRAVIHRDLMEYRKKHPDLYPSETWEKVIRLYETTLFRSIVIARRNDIGRLWSRILFFAGFRKNK